jgi:iron-sulfur cluster repair protein YtfE (RIC family)
MTKRHEGLQTLTHDHHHALAQARLLIIASDKGDDERRSVAETFLSFFEADTLLHFHEEEEVLFPRLLEHVDDPPDELIRVLLDHVRIHGLVAGLRQALADGAPRGEQLKELGETLKGHVRLEEKELFPLIEQVVPESDLSLLSFAKRERAQQQ